jgi:hypothetical protein
VAAATVHAVRSPTVGCARAGDRTGVRREAVGPATMTDMWSRRDGVRTTGDVGPAHGTGAAPMAQRRALGALWRPSSQTFRYARL